MKSTRRQILAAFKSSYENAHNNTMSEGEYYFGWEHIYDLAISVNMRPIIILRMFKAFNLAYRTETGPWL